MKRSSHDIAFAVLLVSITAVIFFSLGVSASAIFGVGKPPKVVIEYKETPTTTTDGSSIPDDADKVNLNTATVNDLMQIDGIGESYAKRIIAYREEIGGYTFLEQLLDVDGVGEKKFNSWAPYLIVEGGMATTAPQHTKINLNTATKEQLMTISGIGEKTAANIVAYRDEIGRFTSLEQLLEVSGVGEKKLESWRGSLTLNDE